MLYVQAYSQCIAGSAVTVLHSQLVDPMFKPSKTIMTLGVRSFTYVGNLKAFSENILKIVKQWVMNVLSVKLNKLAKNCYNCIDERLLPVTRRLKSRMTELLVYGLGTCLYVMLEGFISCIYCYICTM